MASPTEHGINSDGSLNDDYCLYCFRNGEFLHDFRIGEIIEMNIQYLDDFNAHAGTSYTKRQAREFFSTYLPTLKRWQ